MSEDELQAVGDWRVRFDPVTGKLLPDAARFDPFTGERLRTHVTSFFPRPMSPLWIIVQAVWALVAVFVAAAGFTEDSHNPHDLAAGEIGVAFFYSLGAILLAVGSYAYRRWRRLP